MQNNSFINVLYAVLWYSTSIYKIYIQSVIPNQIIKTVSQDIHSTVSEKYGFLLVKNLHKVKTVVLYTKNTPVQTDLAIIHITFFV